MSSVESRLTSPATYSGANTIPQHHSLLLSIWKHRRNRTTGRTSRAHLRLNKFRPRLLHCNPGAHRELVIGTVVCAAQTLAIYSRFYSCSNDLYVPGIPTTAQSFSSRLALRSWALHRRNLRIFSPCIQVYYAPIPPLRPARAPLSDNHGEDGTGCATPDAFPERK